MGILEQDTGVEPAFTAWEAVVLPIYESCGSTDRPHYSRAKRKFQPLFVEGFSNYQESTEAEYGDSCLHPDKSALKTQFCAIFWVEFPR